MEVAACKFHRRAFVALRQLASDEQAQVLETLGALVDTPAAQWPPAQAKRLPGDPPLFLVPVNDSLRLIVRAAEGQEPEVMDVVQHETREAFSKAASSKGE